MFDLSIPQLICPVVIWLTLLFFFTSICFAMREGIIKLRKLHQIPCSRCVFSTGDYRLKCTVHPCKAFSEDAINCLDFEKRQDSQWKTAIKHLVSILTRLNRKGYQMTVRILKIVDEKSNLKAKMLSVKLMLK